ncbi:MAG: YmdB family metallophosphoesterase, partial [Chloroflexi bacterium]|nr:YmdB family metallophosphoesterase [Chloroflexota bacterium]
DSGVDLITSGNHIWDQKEVTAYLNRNVPVLRPLNYPEGVPGKGYQYVDLGSAGGLLVVNLSGRVHLNELDCPFRRIDALLARLAPTVPVVVDFHAEASSEKVAMGWYVDGRVSALLGSHTHVPTADARVLPQGTAFISDVGMVGPHDSVIGADVEAVLKRFTLQMPLRFIVADGPCVFNAVLVDIDRVSRKAVDICRVDRLAQDQSSEIEGKNTKSSNPSCSC